MANCSEQVCQIDHDWALRPSALSLSFIQQDLFQKKRIVGNNLFRHLLTDVSVL